MRPYRHAADALAQGVCTLCHTGNLGDEQHLVFNCPALQEIRDRYNALFGDHAATMVQFMWHHDARAKHSLNNHGGTCMVIHMVILALKTGTRSGNKWLEMM